MRMYVEDNYNRERWPQELGKLTTKFLKNFKDQGGGWDAKDLNMLPRSIDEGFIWGDTPEGHEFWSVINKYLPAQWPPRVAKPKAAGPAPKKKVGWW